MKKQMIIWIMAVCGGFMAHTVYAIPASEYVEGGRLWLFQGTLTGLRNGYAILDSGMKDAGCPDCATDRELIFFHALSRMSMWAVRNNGVPTDSALELAQQNGFHVVGNIIRDLEISSDWQVNRYDAYDLPENLESIIEEIALSLSSDGLAEIDSVLEELNRITETPADRFQVFLTPEETHAFMDPLSPPLGYNLEVDYTDVLLLKGALSAIKAAACTLSAYDLNVPNKQEVIDQFYGNCFSINEGLLLPNPQLGRVLPAGGTQTLVEARQAWLTALTYYQQAIDSMEQENVPAGSDPQDDEFFHQDPMMHQTIRDLVVQLQDSLQNDTQQNYIYESQRSYAIQCTGCDEQNIGQLVLNLDLFGQAENASLSMTQCAGWPAQWESDDIEIVDSTVFASLDYEGTDVVYHGNYYLSYTPSVMLTPIQCQGSTAYKTEVLPTSQFAQTGVAQGWKAGSGFWDYTLPFAFPFFGTAYSQVHISPKGFICFDEDLYGNYWEMESHVRIEPMGSELRTDLTTESDIFIDQSNPDQIIIRWAAHYYDIYNPCNFAVVLYSNGSIRFDYGDGNYSIYPYVGISNGTLESLMYLGEGWGGVTLAGTISPDKNTITNLQLDFWGQPQTVLSGLAANLQENQAQEITLDLNPLFGATARYPDPVSPRDLLPQFNAWNTPVPSTVGHGLGDDPTLGGILPGKTQQDWNKTGYLQPAGHVDWQEIYPWQKSEGWVGFWLDEQLVFEDAVDDLIFEEPSDEEAPGADIAALYIGYDMEYIHGEILCNGILDDEFYRYDIQLSYSPTEPDSKDSLRIHIEVDEYYILTAELWVRYCDEFGYSYWEYLNSIEAEVRANAVCFHIDWWSIPYYVNGRYLTIDGAWLDDESWAILAADENPTQIQIGTAGTLSGTVSYNGFVGAPIYIQAITDSSDPDQNIVAATMITAPGPYLLEGIGLGWKGYIRAFTPLFGLNLTDLDAIAVESTARVSQRYPQVSNVDLTLQNPVVLQQNLWSLGQLRADSNRTDVYAFDAIEGVEYLLEFESISGYDFSLELLGRNGNESLYETWNYYTPNFYWVCPVSGRYYLKAKSSYLYEDETADYQIRYSSDITCPLSDISGAQWSGVRDCFVDIYDLSLLAQHWLQNCEEPYWCDDSDYNRSYWVDMMDFAQLSEEWLISGLSLVPGE